jgi:O-antigen/teichoic acid export membrane protein
MNRLRKVVSNTVVSLIGQAVTWTSTLFLTIAYGRFLGDVKFGELYFAITFVLLIGFPLEFGFNQQLTRDVAQQPARALRYLSNTLLIKGMIWLVLYSLILLVCWLLGYSMEERILVGICGITLLSGSIAGTFAAAHYSFERVVFPVVGKILENGLSALFGILLLRSGAGVQVMALVLLGGSFIGAMWQACWFFRLLGFRLIVDQALIRELVRASIPFLLYGVLGVIYYRLDTILLSLMTSIAVVGWYGAGYRLFDTLVFLPSLVINAIMYPVFAKLSLSSTSTLKMAVEKSLNFLLFCSIPIATTLIVAAPNIINFLYHHEAFTHTYPVLQGLAPGLVFLYINSVLNSVLMSTKREKKITIMAAAALVFNLGLNLILIPRYQHIGAAVVTSLTELLLLCMSVVFVPRHLLPLGSLRVGVKALVASLVMALAIWALHAFNIFVILPVAMFVYLAVAALLGTIPREDLKALYIAMRQRKRRVSPVAAAASQEEELPVGIMPAIDIDEEAILAGQFSMAGTGMEWTDPALFAVGREMLRTDQERYLDEETIPIRALRKQTLLADEDEETIRLPALRRQKSCQAQQAPSKVPIGDQQEMEPEV